MLQLTEFKDRRIVLEHLLRVGLDAILLRLDKSTLDSLGHTCVVDVTVRMICEQSGRRDTAEEMARVEASGTPQRRKIPSRIFRWLIYWSRADVIRKGRSVVVGDDEDVWV